MDQISVYLPGIILAYSVFFVAIASPGPNILAVIGTSMSVGRASGVALALGVAAGSFCWALLTAFGLSALLVYYAAALTVIKIAGGAYLPGWPTSRPLGRLGTRPRGADALGIDRTPVGYAIRGLTIQMTNPMPRWPDRISHWASGERAPVGRLRHCGRHVRPLRRHPLVYALTFSTRPMVACMRRRAGGSGVRGRSSPWPASSCSPDELSADRRRLAHAVGGGHGIFIASSRRNRPVRGRGPRSRPAPRAPASRASRCAGAPDARTPSSVPRTPINAP